jgi:hypothetical protein
MSKAGEQLEPYLPQLVPKLFRYRFDPTPRIQASMASIWQAIVPDPSATVSNEIHSIFFFVLFPLIFLMLLSIYCIKQDK